MAHENGCEEVYISLIFTFEAHEIKYALSCHKTIFSVSISVVLSLYRFYNLTISLEICFFFRRFISIALFSSIYAIRSVRSLWCSV